MINMDDLRPWLESKGETITNEDLETIQGMDKPGPEDQQATIDDLTNKLKESEDRYRAAFFNPPKPDNTNQLPDEEDPQDTPDEPTTFDDLFKPKED